MNLIEMVKAAGVVGAGGAGFPTHVKLNTKVEYFIVNAAECEPLIETDRKQSESKTAMWKFSKWDIFIRQEMSRP